MTDYNCLFCNKKFKSISSLNYHQQNTIYCLKIQGKENSEKNHKCKFCLKYFSSKSNLNQHIESCNKKYKIKEEEIIKKNEEIEKLKLILSERDDQIKQLKEHNNNLLTTISEIAKQPKSNTTNTSTTNIRGNQNVQNILSDYKSYEENTNHERIISIARNNDIEKYFWNGQKGIAKFCVDHIAKTEDGKMIICCTDPSRRRFKCPNEKDEIGEDIDARNFTKKISEPIKEVCEEVYDRIQKNIEEQMNSDQTEYDSSFLNTKKGIAMEKFIEITNINDNANNSEYKKEISILLNV